MISFENNVVSNELVNYKNKMENCGNTKKPPEIAEGFVKLISNQILIMHNRSNTR